jgi:hypothetical protein
MKVITEEGGTPDLITLYRGEAPSSEATLLRDGLTPKDAFLPGSTNFPSIALIRLQQPPFEFAALDAPAIVRHHVERGGASPLLSFSTDQNVACGYALHDGTRSSGLLVSVQVTFVKRITLETAFNGVSSGFFEDSGGRRWIWVEGVRSMYPSRDRHVDLGRRDSEYLLVGSLPPEDFRLHHVSA